MATLGIGSVLFHVSEDTAGEEAEKGCERPTATRILTSLWLLTAVIATIAMAYFSRVSTGDGEEFLHIRVFSAFALVVLAPVACASLFLEDRAWGNTCVLVISLFHLLLTLRIRLPLAYHSSRGDSWYVTKFEGSADAQHMNPRSLAEAAEHPRSLSKFFDYTNNTIHSQEERESFHYLRAFYASVTKLVEEQHVGLACGKKSLGRILGQYSDPESIPVDLNLGFVWDAACPLVSLRIDILREIECRWASKYFGIWPRFKRFLRIYTPPRTPKRNVAHEVEMGDLDTEDELYEFRDLDGSTPLAEMGSGTESSENSDTSGEVVYAELAQFEDMDPDVVVDALGPRLGPQEKQD